jgi:two-component system response regulator DesR
MAGVAADGAIGVLLADDDGGFLAALRPLVESQPELTVVATARDGKQAVELARRVEPDAAVVDLHMPVLGGVEAIAQLRREHPSICLIALTGDETPSLHAAAREAGADDVLTKRDFLDALMRRLTGSRQLV